MSKFLLNLLVHIFKFFQKYEIHLNLKINSVFKPLFESGPTGPVLLCQPTLSQAAASLRQRTRPTS
jgi:hypothetical protein